MTLDLEEAAAIVRTVRETGMKFMVAHPTRYTPAFVLAKKMIMRGAENHADADEGARTVAACVAAIEAAPNLFQKKQGILLLVFLAVF